jgi:hypothetical protein
MARERAHHRPAEGARATNPCNEDVGAARAAERSPRGVREYPSQPGAFPGASPGRRLGSAPASVERSLKPP